MIQVTEEQLHQVEYLINQSLQGNHILFDPIVIKRVFEKDLNEFDTTAAYAVEHHIERLILLPTLAQKHAYLEKLDLDVYESVVRTYFAIIENNLLETSKLKH